MTTRPPTRAVRRTALTWGTLLTLVVAVAGCGSSGSAGRGHADASAGTTVFGTLPSPGTPRDGGRITIGQLSGNTPTYIFPIMPSTNTSGPTLNLIANLYLPLYNIAYGARPTIAYPLSVANPPRFSDGDTTVTIPLKHGLKWSNGAPVDADDVLFDIALLKAAVKESAANWAGYTPGMFPTNLRSASAPNRYTVVLRLKKAYNPGYFLNNQLQILDSGLYPLPSTTWNLDSAHDRHLTDWRNPATAKRIYDYLAKAGRSLSTFTSSPLWRVVDGPFRLTQFNVTNSSYSLAPNPKYGLSPKPRAAEISYQTFTSATAELTAMQAGGLDIDPNFDTTQLGEVSTLRHNDITVYGSPDFAWEGGIINFKDTTDHFDKVIAQLYVRQAIAHLIDQPALIKGIFKNAAVPAYGPVPSQPHSPYAPASAGTDPYPYTPKTSASLLRSHGWKVVPGGQTTCAHPGTGAHECGAGIPAGTPLRFTWATEPQSVEASGVLSSEAIASIAKRAAGINIAVQVKTPNFLYANYNNANPGAARYKNDWGVVNSGVGNLYFPTQEGTFNPSGPYNVGGYDDATANRLMKASTSSRDPSAVTTEAAYFEKHLPVFFLPNQDFLVAVSKRIGGSRNSWLTLSQVFQLPQFWYLTK